MRRTRGSSRNRTYVVAGLVVSHAVRYRRLCVVAYAGVSVVLGFGSPSAGGEPDVSDHHHCQLCVPTTRR